MRIAGIVAEYNPFHKGHAYQIETLRSMGIEGIVVAMSGNLVQRAAPALWDKYTRAEAAVICGADLVLELPLPYAVASGEDFAMGGISVLTATGVVDTVCCGCESDGEQNLLQYKTLREAEREGLLKKHLQQGLSYPAACKAVVLEKGGFWSEEPNDVLALSYRKALEKVAPSLPLTTVKRRGNYHGDGNDGFESAQSIRARILRGENVTDALPRGEYEFLSGKETSGFSRAERAILTYYRMARPEDLNGYYGMREGLASRICEHADAADLEQLFDRVKTKRFPHSAVRRAVLCGYLRLPQTLPEITYLRVLAFNQRGQKILKQMKTAATLPVVPILTPQMRKDPRHAPLTEAQLRGDEFFAMTLPTPGKKLRDLTVSAKKV